MTVMRSPTSHPSCVFKWHKPRIPEFLLGWKGRDIPGASQTADAIFCIQILPSTLCMKPLCRDRSLRMIIFPSLRFHWIQRRGERLSISRKETLYLPHYTLMRAKFHRLIQVGICCSFHCCKPWESKQFRLKSYFDMNCLMNFLGALLPLSI